MGCCSSKKIKDPEVIYKESLTPSQLFPVLIQKHEFKILSYLPFSDILKFRQLNKYFLNLTENPEHVMEIRSEGFSLEDQEKITEKLEILIKSHKYDPQRKSKVIEIILKLNVPLTQLKFWGSDFTQYDACFLAKICQIETSLACLSLRGNLIRMDGIRELAPSINMCKHLKDLDLGGNMIENKGLEFLAKELGENQTIKKLSLKSNGLSSNGVLQLSNALKINNSLLTLDLGNNDIEGHEIKYLAESLANNRTLEYLDLSLNKVDDEGAQSIGTLLTDNSTLKNISLEGNYLGRKGGNAIITGLNNNSSLTHLSLKGNGIQGEGISAFESLVVSSLIELDLSGITLKNIGVKYISKFLEFAKCIQFLYLESNLIGTEGITYLIEGLKNNNSLSTLGLGYNNIDDKGLVLLNTWLINSRSLKSLDLSSNKLVEEGILELSKLLTTSQIAIIDLSTNPLSDVASYNLSNIVFSGELYY